MKRLLLIFSILCLVASLTVFLVLPVVAGADNGITIELVNDDPVGGQFTAHAKITNVNSEKDVTLKYLEIYFWHYGETFSPPTPPASVSGDLITTDVVLGPGDDQEWSWTFTLNSGDYDHKLVDMVVIEGNNDAVGEWPLGWFKAYYPYYVVVPPVPELSAGVLFGMGVLGLGGFFWLKRRNAGAKI